MPDGAWPSALPDSALVAGLRHQTGESVVRTTMEVGPRKQRKRSAAVPHAETVAILLETDSQVEILESFYATQGAEPFTGFRWSVGSDPTARLRFTAPPEFAFVDKRQVWRATLSVEVLP